MNQFYFAFYEIASLLVMTHSKRLFVFQHFRHGARSPLKDVNDNYEDLFNEKWNGVGELSSVGLRMLYLLGIHDKKRYSSFLQPVFDTNEVLIYSTNINRTILSVSAYMQGLYPEATKITLDQKQIDASFPQKIDKATLAPAIAALNNNILPNQMSLFPIHVFNPHDRTFLLNDNSICPGIVKYKEKNVASTEMQTASKGLSDKFDSSFGSKLREYFKLTDPKHYYKRETIFAVTDTFIADLTDARAMKVFKETKINLEAFMAMSQEVAYFDTYQLEFNSQDNMLSIMAMSPTFESIIGWMEKRIKKDKEGKDFEIHGSEPRMIVYSGHDTTMATMHFFIEQVFKKKVNDHTYATNQHFELIENDKQYTVEYYSNDAKIFAMPFEEFKTQIQKVLWSKEKINDFCDEKSKGLDPFIIASIALGALTVGLSIALTILCLKKKRETIAAQ